MTKLLCKIFGHPQELMVDDYDSNHLEDIKISCLRCKENLTIEKDGTIKGMKGGHIDQFIKTGDGWNSLK